VPIQDPGGGESKAGNQDTEPEHRMASRRKSHATTALVLVDFIHALVSESGPELARGALKAARHTAMLKQKAVDAGIPVVYANDHFGDWGSDFPSLVEACRRQQGCAGKLVELLAPGPRDFSILKPRHSAFYGTPLEFLLDELEVTQLILAGLETDICVMYTAQDAYMRRYGIWIPRNCTASRSSSRAKAAIGFMQTNLKADVRPVTRDTRLSRSSRAG
jgi:nicotinamidase-related amidase